MAGKKVGSDGQIRKTTAEWAADTDTYPEGMRLMDTETGSVRVSKGTTYALAWQAASSGAATWSTNHGTYTAGLVVNPYDLVSKNGILYESISATFTTTNWATDQASFSAVAYGQAAVNAAIAAAIPKRYKWIGDGGAATGTEIANTLGVTINVTNPSTGTYVFTAASGTPFTANKTTIYVQSVDGGTAYITGADNPSSSTSIQEVHTYDIAGVLDNSPRYQVIIEVEP